MKKLFLILPLCLVHSYMLGAAYYLHADMVATTSPDPAQTWTVKSLWFDDPTGGTDMGSAPFTGNDFFLNGFDLRTGVSSAGSSSFSGASLNFASSTERLDLLAATANISNTLNVSGGGAILVHSTRSAVALNVGTLNASGIFSFRAATSDESLALSVTTLAGDGDLIFGNRFSTQVDAGSYSISVTDASSFTGRLLPDDGVLTIASASFSQATLFLDTVDASKAATVNISTSASFAAIEGSSLSVAAGTYTAAELNTLFSATRFTGAGSLTVVPEPSTFALFAGLLALGFLVRRRI